MRKKYEKVQNQVQKRRITADKAFSNYIFIQTIMEFTFFESEND